MKTDKWLQYEEMQKQIAEEMQNDERYKEFFAQYREDSVKRFVTEYAKDKANLLVFGDYATLSQRRLMGTWQNLAWDSLEAIQHKKLFDLSCRWQAEEVTNLPEIDISEDFTVVGQEILDYPGLPDITETDIGLYLRFLKSPVEGRDFYIGFDYDYQQYDTIRDCYEKYQDTEIPYYDFHNLLTGNSYLFGLPSIRMQKEKHYFLIGFAHHHKSPKPRQPVDKVEQPAAPPPKPYLENVDEVIIKFGERFNDRKTAHFIIGYRKWIKERPDIDIDPALEYLKAVCPERVPITAHSDWQEGIYRAAAGHQRKRVSELLPAIYEEYLMKKSAGISLTRKDQQVRDFGNARWRKELILEGRRLMGEPINFDF